MKDTSMLRKTPNYWRCIGEVYENGLKREETDIKLRDENGNQDGTMKGERIYGTIAIKIDTGIVELNVYAQSHTSKGEANKQWKMYCDMLEWTPSVNGDGSTPALVNVEGSIDVNDYVNRDGEMAKMNRYRVSRGSTRVDTDAVPGMSAKGTFYIGDIQKEVVNEEETGRLIVTLYAVNNQGQAMPITVYVKDDLADDFEDAFEVGQTVKMDLDMEHRHIGGATATDTKKAFGKGSKVAVNNGYDRFEIFIVGADEPIEEPDEDSLVDENGNPVEDTSGYISPKAMAKALKERKKMLEEKKAAGYQGGNADQSKSKGSMKDRKATMTQAKKAGMPKTSGTDTDAFDDEDDPF